MKTLELKIPPAIVVLIVALLMWATDQVLPTFKFVFTWSQWLAVSVFVLALVPILAGVFAFKNAKTTVDPTQPNKASTVVTSGVYRYTRNPMYLGFLLGLLAFAIKLSNPLAGLFLPLFVVYMNQFQIKPEERALSDLFGADYQSYLVKVRRWL